MLKGGSLLFQGPGKDLDSFPRLAFGSVSVGRLRELGPRLATAFNRVAD